MRRLGRKIKRVFGVPLTDKDRNDDFCIRLKSDSRMRDVKASGQVLSFRYKDDAEVYCRMFPHSDPLVCEQVLLKEEYLPVVDLLRLNLPARKEFTVIDAGSNVGYASLYFLSALPGAAIACIEPDHGNLAALKKNLRSFIDNKQVRVFGNAVMGRPGVNLRVSHDFRDQRDWSTTIMETGEDSSLKSITIDQVMEEMDWPELDLLKMDIEGAERFVFADEAATGFLARTRICCIEIHDEFNIRPHIYQKLKEQGFIILNCGEATIGINRRFFS